VLPSPTGCSGVQRRRRRVGSGSWFDLRSPANTRTGHDRERALDRSSLQDCVRSRPCQAAQAPQFNAAVRAAAVSSIYDPLANPLASHNSERSLGRSGLPSLSKPTSVTKPERS
jgi:hypothetical protein